MQIHEKLIEVARSVQHLQKKAKGHKYKYVSSSQVITALRAKWLELNLLLLPQATNIKVEPAPTYGGRQHVVTANMIYTWINLDNTDEAMTFDWQATGMDADTAKAYGKALTYAEKYFLLKFFQIPTDEDDPDKDQKPNRPEHQHTWSDNGRKRFFAVCRERNLNDHQTEEFRVWLVQQARIKNPAAQGLDDGMISYLANNFDDLYSQWQSVVEYAKMI